VPGHRSAISNVARCPPCGSLLSSYAGRAEPQAEVKDLSARLIPRRLINRLAHIQRLRETTAVDPGDHVADLKARILNPHRHPVLCPGASEGQQVAARLKHPQALSPNVFAGNVVVPLLAHKAQTVRRVRHASIHAAGRQLPQPL
jgi:hypothetical protein